MLRRLVVCFLLVFVIEPIFSQEEVREPEKKETAPTTETSSDGNSGSEPMDDEAFGMVRQFMEYDASARLRARTVFSELRQVYKFEKIVFNGALGRRIPAQLAIPRIRVAPYPCVLLIHDLAGSKDDWWEDENLIRGGLLARKLLASGHAVLCLDLPAHGERTQEQDYEPTSELAFSSQQGSRLRSLLFQGVVDQRRALDYLETREEIDSSRIAVNGYGYGGLVALMLTTAEPRVGAINVCALPMANGNPAVFAPRHFAPRLSGKPVQVLAGRFDQNAPEEQTRHFHQLIDSVKKKLHVYESNHRLPKEYSEHVLQWIRTQLKAVEEVLPAVSTEGR